MLELEELSRSMRGFAKRNNPGMADDWLQGLHVGEAVLGFDRRESNGVRPNPIDR
jgi:hypothetical protein